MSIGSINPLSNNNYLQSILTSALQSTGLTTNSTNNSLSTSASSSVSQSPDNSRLSPFAQVMSELQQLQQSDPSKYQQVTSQIATNLQTAAAAGNTTAATQLNQLATDFSSASKNGQLPNVQDLAQAVGGHHHHHHHHAEAASTDPAGTASTGSSSSGSSSSSQELSQILAAFQASGTQSAATDPTSIIMSTLSSAGITGA